MKTIEETPNKAPAHKVGQAVLYTLSEQDAEQINRRRAGAQAPAQPGSVVHVGNKAEAGQIFPMTIVRTWGDTPESCVNGQVTLDGNDALWVTSRSVGEGPGHFTV